MLSRKAVRDIAVESEPRRRLCERPTSVTRRTRIDGYGWSLVPVGLEVCIHNIDFER
jgi:hypothetical protein